MRISDWSSDVCSSDLGMIGDGYAALGAMVETIEGRDGHGPHLVAHLPAASPCGNRCILILSHIDTVHPRGTLRHFPFSIEGDREIGRATSELQSLMRISYAVFCLKKKKKHRTINNIKKKRDT